MKEKKLMKKRRNAGGEDGGGGAGVEEMEEGRDGETRRTWRQFKSKGRTEKGGESEDVIPQEAREVLGKIF
jgi:hypothetical protein